MRCWWVMIFLSALLVSCGETEKKRRTLGYKGEAKNNPFLAAQRYLQSQGREVGKEHGVGNYEERAGMLFLPPSSINTIGRSKRLLEWVSEGGHLVVMLEGGGMGGHDFTVRPEGKVWEDPDEELPGLEYLLDALGVALIEWECVPEEGGVDPETLEVDDWEEMDESDRVLLGAERIEMQFEDEEVIEVHHWSDWGFEYEEVYMGEYGSGEAAESTQHRYLSVIYDEGRVSLLADGRPLRNRYIGYAGHARLLDQLCQLSPDGEVLFSSGEGDGLVSMMWRHFPEFVVALLLAVGLWLWLHLPRFGPTQDITGSGHLELSSQLRGVGRFLWSHKRDDVLLESLRSMVRRRLSMSGGRLDEGLFEQLAGQSGLKLEEVLEAMTREAVHDAGVMVRMTNHLQLILNTLNTSK